MRLYVWLPARAGQQIDYRGPFQLYVLITLDCSTSLTTGRYSSSETAQVAGEPQKAFCSSSLLAFPRVTSSLSMRSF